MYNVMCSLVVEQKNTNQLLNMLISTVETTSANTHTGISQMMSSQDTHSSSTNQLLTQLIELQLTTMPTEPDHLTPTSHSVPPDEHHTVDTITPAVASMNIHSEQVHVVSLPEPTMSLSVPAVSLSVPAVSLPEPTMSLSVPAVSLPEPTVSLPEPAVSVPDPTVSLSVPAVSLPEPAVSEQIPTVSEQIPTVSEHVPTVSEHVPAVSEHVPVVSEHVPAMSVLEPTVSVPESAVSHTQVVVSHTPTATSEPTDPYAFESSTANDSGTDSDDESNLMRTTSGHCGVCLNGIPDTLFGCSHAQHVVCSECYATLAASRARCPFCYEVVFSRANTAYRRFYAEHNEILRTNTSMSGRDRRTHINRMWAAQTQQQQHQ